jgi:hypothetical protein
MHAHTIRIANERRETRVPTAVASSGIAAGESKGAAKTSDRRVAPTASTIAGSHGRKAMKFLDNGHVGPCAAGPRY